MELSKFSVIIIESLPEGEKKTGEELFSTTIKYNGFKNPGIHSELLQVDSKLELIYELEILSKKAIDKSEFYFLHFEMHGFIGGIQTANGDKVTWSALFPVFRKINIHYGNSLMICLAVCEGGSIIASTNAELRSPFNLLIACVDKMFEKEIIEGFEAFYNEFYESFNVSESINAYNSKVSNDDNKLSSITSEYLFDMVTDVNRFPDNKLSMVLKTKKELAKDKRNKNLTEFQLIKKSTLIVEKLFEELKKKKDYFLMKDLE